MFKIIKILILKKSFLQILSRKKKQHPAFGPQDLNDITDNVLTGQAAGEVLPGKTNPPLICFSSCITACFLCCLLEGYVVLGLCISSNNKLDKTAQ